MTSKGMQDKETDIEEQWVFKVKELTDDQLLEVAARCTEIAIRGQNNNGLLQTSNAGLGRKL